MSVNDAAQLGEMVAPTQIRRSIRRLFPNTPTVILGEILQNSQRAGAHHVDFVMTPSGFQCWDDGHGLQDGVQGFHALLQMGRSHFLDPHTEDQDPMGLGIHAILACADISAVTFASHGLRLPIVTERWWEEQPYYSTWFERMEVEESPTRGFFIEVAGTPAFRDQVRSLLGECGSGCRWTGTRLCWHARHHL
ncbi:MAG: hypothetical protein H0X24_01145 [Ktedonobacterales bacterium]|nr:hypothetical protein [Ktedonobacterales bacterium]